MERWREAGRFYKGNQPLYHYNMKARALLKVAVCHMPQQSACSLILPAGLVNSHLIRMQIPLIRLIYQDLFSCDHGIEWKGN